MPVLLNNAIFSIFKFIEVSGNNVQNAAQKDLIGIDASSTGTTTILGSGNTIAVHSFLSTWASATIPAIPGSFVVGYKIGITSTPALPLLSCFWLPLI